MIDSAKDMPLFEIEAITPIADRGVFIFARHTNEIDFAIGPGLLLGEAEITYADIPRALDSDGRPRLDLWGFHLAEPTEASRFRVGEVVALDDSNVDSIDSKGNLGNDIVENATMAETARKFDETRERLRKIGQRAITKLWRKSGGPDDAP